MKSDSLFANDMKQLFLFTHIPYQQNERIRKQQGLFLVPSIINISIDDILKDYKLNTGMLNGQLTAVKLTFKKEMIQNFWHRLKKMNITHETIYPGLEGFCKSLKLNLL